ncbi:hypothetical protein [Lacisediminihabitans changchengi]|uniref:Uncharacterized protein n=1 Tax=Lacisediminihabitans changchengi TaxID=2787634 RepID=A0A934W255_9MICO|nr:hypothetical protein [Lacisediminihabitans changchengi]MBK4346486.1 hypothetical protein [Lacisediminihabitans changchengi]
MSTRWARFARGWIAAVVSVFVALCSHLLAGGDSPGLPGILLCLAFAGMICIALSGRALSTPRLTIAVGASQFLFHGVFGMLGAAPMSISGGHMDMNPQLTMSAQPMLSPLPLAAADSGMAMPGWMWFAHAVAAVITVLALRFGERAFWQLLALASPLLRMLLALARPVRVSTPPASVPAADAMLPPRLVVLSTHRHRGPPALAAL